MVAIATASPVRPDVAGAQGSALDVAPFVAWLRRHAACPRLKALGFSCGS
jgi:hypothetical protein